MRVLTRDEILEAKDLKVSEEIPVPEWAPDGCMHARMLMGEERDAFESLQAKMSEAGKWEFMRNIRARMVALFACDAEGKRIFTDKDAVALGKKSAAALDRVFEIGRKLNGWTKEDVKELEKTSEDAPNDGTGTD